MIRSSSARMTLPFTAQAKLEKMMLPAKVSVAPPSWLARPKTQIAYAVILTLQIILIV
jgi:hypothetical protein